MVGYNDNKGDMVMGRKIVITSGKGGVGKTTLTAGLGRALAGLGFSVCLVDADIGLNNLDIAMEAENKVVYDLADCMQSNCRLRQALIADYMQENLFLLSSGKALSGEQIVGFGEIVNKLAVIFDFVLVDCPAGKEDGFFRAIKACEEAILVTTAHPSAMRDASRIAHLVHAALGNRASLVINRQRGDLVAAKEAMDYAQIGKLLNLKVIGVLPECDSYNISSSIAAERKANTKLWISLQLTAKNVANGTEDVFDCTAGYCGLIGTIKRKLKGL